MVTTITKRAGRPLSVALVGLAGVAIALVAAPKAEAHHHKRSDRGVTITFNSGGHYFDRGFRGKGFRHGHHKGFNRGYHHGFKHGFHHHGYKPYGYRHSYRNHSYKGYGYNHRHVHQRRASSCRIVLVENFNRRGPRFIERKICH